MAILFNEFKTSDIIVHAASIDYSNYYYYNWVKYLLQVKQAYVIDLVCKYSEELNITTPNIMFYDNLGTDIHALYNYNLDIINISNEYIDNVVGMIETAAHEVRHAYHYKSNTVEKSNFLQYRRYADGYEEYKSQLIEIDANQYACVKVYEFMDNANKQIIK